MQAITTSDQTLSAIEAWSRLGTMLVSLAPGELVQSALQEVADEGPYTARQAVALRWLILQVIVARQGMR